MANLYNRYGTMLSVNPVRVRLTEEEMTHLAYHNVCVRIQDCLWFQENKHEPQDVIVLSGRWQKVTDILIGRPCPDCGELVTEGDYCLCEIKF